MNISIINLSSPYNSNWSYIENLLPIYLNPSSNNITLFANHLQYTMDNKINFVKSELVMNNNHVEVIKIRFLFTNSRFFNFFNSRIRIYTCDLNKTVEEKKPDLIIVIGLNFLNLSTLLRHLKKKNPRLKIFFYSGATDLNSAGSFLSKYILHRKLYRGMIKSTLKLVDKVYLGSERALNFFENNYSTLSDYRITHLGVDEIAIKESLLISKVELRKKWNFKSSDFIIIFGGKIVKEKNLQNLIDGFLMYENPNSKLIIFGEISKEVLADVESKINVHNCVEFLGWQEPRKIYELLNISDLAVFSGSKSSLWEVVVALGVPLIAKRWHGYEYLDFGGNVKWIGNNDPKSIYSAILELSDEKTLNSMRLIANSNGIEKLSYASFANTILSDFYGELDDTK